MPLEVWREPRRMSNSVQISTIPTSTRFQKIGRWMRRHKVWTSILIIYLVFGSYRKIVLWQAISAYDASRGHPEWSHTSPQFIAHGITAGMKRAEVDRLLINADGTRTSQTVVGAQPPYFGMYHLHYGQSIPFAWPKKFFIYETFVVRFNQDGNVVDIDRTLLGPGDMSSEGIDFLAGGEVEEYFKPEGNHFLWWLGI